MTCWMYGDTAGHELVRTWFDLRWCHKAKLGRPSTSTSSLDVILAATHCNVDIHLVSKQRRRLVFASCQRSIVTSWGIDRTCCYLLNAERTNQGKMSKYIHDRKPGQKLSIKGLTPKIEYKSAFSLCLPFQNRLLTCWHDCRR